MENNIITKEGLKEAMKGCGFHIDTEHLTITEQGDGTCKIDYYEPTFLEILTGQRLPIRIPLKVEILSDDMFPLKKGEIIELPFYNENLQEERCGWQCWKIYEGGIDGKVGIIIEEKKNKGDYWKCNIFIDDDLVPEYIKICQGAINAKNLL